jgi:hypothetical protein
MARVAMLIQADLKLIKKSPRVMIGRGRWMVESDILIDGYVSSNTDDGFDLYQRITPELVLTGPAVIELQELTSDGGKVTIYVRKLGTGE